MSYFCMPYLLREQHSKTHFDIVNALARASVVTAMSLGMQSLLPDTYQATSTITCGCDGDVPYSVQESSGLWRNFLTVFPAQFLIDVCASALANHVIAPLIISCFLGKKHVPPDAEPLNAFFGANMLEQEPLEDPMPDQMILPHYDKLYRSNGNIFRRVLFTTGSSLFFGSQSSLPNVAQALVSGAISLTSDVVENLGRCCCFTGI